MEAAMVFKVPNKLKPYRWNFVSLLYLSASSGFLAYSRWFYPNDMQCVKHLYPYSPVLEAVRYSWINYADWFYPHSPLRGDPTKKPEIEDAWKEYIFGKQ